MKAWVHPLWSNAENFQQVNKPQNLSLPIVSLRKKVSALATALLISSATPVWAQETSNVLLWLDKELLFHELEEDRDSYDYYLDFLSNGDVYERLSEVFTDINVETWFLIQWIDVTFFADLDTARYSGDQILWQQTYGDIINLYSAFSDDLKTILTKHWYNPHGWELA